MLQARCAWGGVPADIAAPTKKSKAPACAEASLTPYEKYTHHKSRTFSEFQTNQTVNFFSQLPDGRYPVILVRILHYCRYYEENFDHCCRVAFYPFVRAGKCTVAGGYYLYAA
jgi:hypothetical protein